MDLITALGKLKTPKMRQYILLLIAGMDKADAKEYVSEQSYWRWMRNPAFREVMDNLPELSHNYSDEAISRIRLHSTTEALGLEQSILEIIKEEIKTKKYNLLKTNLGKEILLRKREGRLGADLVKKKVGGKPSWEDRMEALGVPMGKGKKGKKRYTLEPTPEVEEEE